MAVAVDGDSAVEAAAAAAVVGWRWYCYIEAAMLMTSSLCLDFPTLHYGHGVLLMFVGGLGGGCNTDTPTFPGTLLSSFLFVVSHKHTHSNTAIDRWIFSFFCTLFLCFSFTVSCFSLAQIYFNYFAVFPTHHFVTNL